MPKHKRKKQKKIKFSSSCYVGGSRWERYKSSRYRSLYVSLVGVSSLSFKLLHLASSFLHTIFFVNCCRKNQLTWLKKAQTDGQVQVVRPGGLSSYRRGNFSAAKMKEKSLNLISNPIPNLSLRYLGTTRYNSDVGCAYFCVLKRRKNVTKKLQIVTFPISEWLW